ncbi:hypothetical protein Hanom_Chr17g01532721 [Helianthus anomalus]
MVLISSFLSIFDILYFLCNNMNQNRTRRLSTLNLFKNGNKIINVMTIITFK